MEHKFIRKFALVVWGLFNLTIANAQSHFNSDYGTSIQNFSGGQSINGAGVNEFTGQVTYGINIAELNLNGTKYPVTIGYASNGIKVDEYASNVGLGWNLSAGGIITKVTQGVDDDLLGPNGEHIGYNTTPTIAANAYSVYSGQRDSGKDYYVFNILGQTGKFCKFNTNDYATVEGERLKVEFNPNFGAVGRFVITDNMGNKFNFTIKEVISTYKDNSSTASHTTDGSWFLTSVELADGKSINLTYETKLITKLKSSISEVQTSLFADNSALNPSGCSPTGCKYGWYDKSVWYNTYNSYKIKRIETIGQSIVFNYSGTPRLDIADDYQIASIQHYLNNELNRQYNFNYQYISGRLMLASILEITQDLNLTNTLVEFEYYNSYVMPPPFSLYSQDSFGYFNGQPVYLNCKSDEPSLIIKGDLDQDIGGVDRSIAHSDLVQTLLLKKVTNKFGAVQEIKYENNKYAIWNNGIGAIPGWVDVNHFGVRVYQLTSYNITEPTKKNYSMYTYKLLHNNKSTGVPAKLFADYRGAFTSNNGCDGAIRFAGNSFRKLIGSEHLIVYEVVQRSTYTNELDIAGSRVSMTEKLFSVNAVGEYAPYKCGNLRSITQFNSLFQIVDKEEYIYSYINGASFPTVEAYVSGLNQNTLNYYGVNYTLVTGQKHLVQKKHTKCSSAGQPLQTETNIFTYDNLDQVIKVENKVNNNTLTYQYYAYPYHYNVATANDSYAEAIKYMNDNNIKRPIIEVISTRNVSGVEYVTSSSLKLFNVNWTSNNLYVKREFQYRNFNPEIFYPISANSYSRLTFTGGVANFSSRFFETREVQKVDRNGNVSSVLINNRTPLATMSKYSGETYATFSNTNNDEASFLGFEDYETDVATSLIAENWTVGSVNCFNNAMANNSGYTGMRGLNFTLCNGLTLTNTKSMNSGKAYILRYWKKQGAVTVQSNGGIITNAKVIYTNGLWTLIEHIVTNATSITLSSSDALIDDLVLTPSESNYTYSVFDKLTRVTAKCSDSGQIEFYEYDALGRLLLVRDASSNIIKRMEYGIKEQQ